ncbi:MAG: Ig-like domain-containing protein, partial [Candidatus Micrarchaeota archaeon]
VTVGAGEYTTFKASGYDQYGNNVTAPPLVYSLRGGTGTAEITSAGVFIGHKAGAVTVRADAPSDSSLSAALRVTIVGGEAQRLEIVSGTGQFKLREGESVRLSVTGYDAYDNPTGAGEVFWDVSDPSVASITQDGTLTGNAAGIVTVYAYRGAANASHAFNVMPSAKPFNLIPAGSLGQTGTEARVMGPSNVVAESTEVQQEIPAATAGGTGLFSAAAFPWLAGALVLIVIVAVVAYAYARGKAEEDSRKPRLPQKIPAWAKPPLDAEPVDGK